MNKKSEKILKIAQKSGGWEACLASFPEQHQWILRAIGNKSLTSNQVAQKLLKSSRSIGSAMSRLTIEGILNREQRGVYAVKNKEFATYLELQVIELTQKDVGIEVEKTIYCAVSPLFEALEHQNVIVGNGHHIAQKLALQGKEMILQRWR